MDNLIHKKETQLQDTKGTSVLTATELVEGWCKAGVKEGMPLMVHSSLSSLGYVEGGANTVVESLRTAVGATGTVVMPAFTPHIADPHPDQVGIPDTTVIKQRAEVPIFDQNLVSSMGSVPEALRKLPDSLRSYHPQASVTAIGAGATDIVDGQSLGFAVGHNSPFGRLHDIGGYILLIGVGHNRNTFLHYAETLTPQPRLKIRRFPLEVDNQRVWVETLDVANDNDTYFPIVGQEFEEQANIHEVMVGDASCRLIPIQPFVSFATRRLTELLSSTPHNK